MVALLVVALLFGIAGWYWVQAQPAAQRRSALLRLVLFAAVGLVLLAVLTGRTYLVLAVLAALLPLLKRLLPGLVLGRLLRGGIPGMGKGAGSGPSPGNRSRVASEVLEMQLDHDSGDMSGRVLQGPFEGRELADLGEAEFIELLQYCRNRDADSARLLETYLDRRFGDSWREDDPQGARQERGEAGGAGQPMGEREALDILGLEPGASREEIIRAHRQMMQKLHPDRGGSTYLAALINEAKDLLLAGR